MDLLQLKYFKVVAEQEHITKSAKLLMVSQPYLSAIVARLEEEMGGQLFDRDGRNVVLNEYGKILLHHANEALQHLEDAKKEIADMRSRDTKYIRLGSSSTMLSKRWLVDFLKEHDDIRLAHLLAAHNEIMDGLLSGRFDFGLTTGRLDHPKIISVPLWKDRYTLLVGARHPMARRRKIYLQDIKNEKICALPEDQSKLRIVDELCKKAGFEPDFVLEGNVELLSDYMREGLGASFGLASVRDAYRDIRSIPLADEIGEASIYLSWCGERYLTNSMLTLQSYLREVGKQIEAEV